MTSICPGCGDAYQRLAQHWAMSSECSAPPISEDQHEILAGLALAGASIYEASDSANPKFRTVTHVERRARWWDEALGWLSDGVRPYRPDRDDGREPGHQVTTLAHHGLERYRWTLEANGAPPDSLSLTPIVARAWLSHGGGVACGPQPRLSFGGPASADRRERIAEMLRSIGLDPTVTDQQVALTIADTRDLQEYAAPTVPGAEHRWATGEAEYRALKEQPKDESEYRVELCKAALEIARERLEGELSPERFASVVDDVPASSVADLLGGGSWEDALSAAGVSQFGSKPAPRGPYGSGGGRPEVYSDEELLDALRAAADELGAPVGQREYRDWSDNNEGAPAVKTLRQRFGSWAAAHERAGLEVREFGGSSPQ